jgi:ribosomal protein L11 methyltransferase
LIRLAIRAPADAAEQVLAALLEIAPSGVEQVDGDGHVEFAVYGTPGELPELEEGPADVGGIEVTVSGTEVADDWAERWKRFHEPILVGDRLYVRPPWEDASPRPGVVDLEIDPGRAFGTGSHSTTRLCQELLLELAGEGPTGSLCDLGCGSGVLAIAAAELGFGPVEALDYDPLAVEATAVNARVNAVTLDTIRRADLREEPAPAADVVVANLMRPLLLRVAELMRDPPRALVLSGLLDDEADEIAAAFAPLTERRRLSDRGWSALLLT